MNGEADDTSEGMNEENFRPFSGVFNPLLIPSCSAMVSIVKAIKAQLKRFCKCHKIIHRGILRPFKSTPRCVVYAF